MKKNLLLCLILITTVFAQDAFSQSRKVTGRITNAEDGTPLLGVTIGVKGTPIGTVTDNNGSYQISVPENSKTLTFSFIGYKTKEVAIASGEFSFSMEVDSKGLSEIVVTALGIEREKRSLGYSSTEIQGKDLVQSRETNLVQSIAGKVAGVQVTGSGGTPGASSKIIIRGNKSFTGENQPLFVIDGVPMDNQTPSTNAQDNPFNEFLEQVNYSNRAVDINPDDIENVTFLKGPSAAALYGVRAGNGAVIITTKKAKYGQGPQVSFSSDFSIDQVNKLPLLQSTYAQGSGGGRIAGTPTYVTYTPGANGIYEDGGGDDVRGIPNQWGPTNASLGITPFDNVGNFFQNGYKYENNLSISGGSEQNSNRFSVGRLSQSGVIPNTNFDRTSLRLTSQSQLGRYFSTVTTINYINSQGTRAQQGSNLSGVMLGLLRAPSSFDLAAGYEWPNGTNRSYFSPYDNPFWTVNNNPYNDNTNRVLGNVAINFYPSDWLKFTFRPGTDFYTTRSKQIYAIGSNNSVRAKTGEIRENAQFQQEFYSDLILTATKELSESIDMVVTLGNNLNQRYNKNLFARGSNLALPDFYNFGNASERYTDESNSRIRTAAYYANVNLSYKELIYLGLVGRQEWASTFGINRRDFFFPGANLSFVFTELEAFKSLENIISFGKIRVSSATAANIPSPYSSVSTFNQPFFTDGYTDGFSFPYQGQSGYGKSNVLGNPNLEPEINKETEVGIEMKMFKERLTLDVTYYNQQTSNILLLRPISFSTGHAAIYDNSGAMENKGIEIAIGLIPIKTTNFSWNIDFNFTRNRSLVKKLAEGVEQIEIETGFGDPGVFAKINQPYGSIYGTKWERNAAGELIIDDATGLPTAGLTLEPLGSPNPDYMIGFRNSFTYKRVTLTGLLDIRQGGVYWNGTQARLNRIGASEASADREKTYIIEGVKASNGSKNDIAIDAIDYWQSYKGDFGATEEAIQDISWIRLREVGISYSLKTNLKHVKSIDFNVSGRNLLLFTPYTGVDPETSLVGSGSNYGGVDWFGMPNTKSYNFGVRLNIM